MRAACSSPGSACTVDPVALGAAEAGRPPAISAAPAPVADSPRYTFIKGDIRDGGLLDELFPSVDAVVHFAAESHVDRSVRDASIFVETNVLGTQQLLDAALRNNVERFVHVSTDEV